ncbi:MAG: SdrD B-like domain-containing protein, partial [Anaerolineales bacterium]
YGYEPTTAFPGLCPLPATPTPTPQPGSIAGGVFNDMNGNGVRNGGEPGISGVTVRLGHGACGSTGAGNTTTAGNGSFAFNDLPAGTYCVSVNIISDCGGWLPTTVTQRTVTVGPGEAKLIAWFGYAVYIC